MTEQEIADKIIDMITCEDSEFYMKKHKELCTFSTIYYFKSKKSFWKSIVYVSIEDGEYSIELKNFLSSVKCNLYKATRSKRSKLGSLCENIITEKRIHETKIHEKQLEKDFLQTIK